MRLDRHLGETRAKGTAKPAGKQGVKLAEALLLRADMQKKIASQTTDDSAQHDAPHIVQRASRTTAR
jgi:hypothetical protein